MGDESGGICDDVGITTRIFDWRMSMRIILFFLFDRGVRLSQAAASEPSLSNEGLKPTLLRRGSAPGLVNNTRRAQRTACSGCHGSSAAMSVARE